MRNSGNWTICSLLLVVLVIACSVSVFFGAVRVPFSEMHTSGIIHLRVARILLAVVAGAGLSVAGVVYQALFRNPLAEPYVLGVSSGAGLGAAVAILLQWATLSIWTLPASAFVGALATILLVYALAKDRSGNAPPQTLLLSGVMINAVFGGLLMYLVSAAPSDRLHDVMWWLLGNLQVFNWSPLQLAAGFIALGLLGSVLFARDLNVLTLGEEPAAHLGLNVEGTKRVLLALASLMTGAAVATCGLIGFVGLIVPHSVRMVLGPDHRRLVPASALTGSLFLVLADMVARTIHAPSEIPIGVITAVLGGPFFFVLLRRKRHSSWG